MTMEEKISMLEDIMDLDEGTLTLDSVLDDLEEWDSLSKLSLIVAAKQNFGLILKADILQGFKTVNDICQYLQ